MIREDNKNESIEKQAQDSRIEYNDVHHMNEVIKELLANRKEGGLDEFEDISMYIKKKMTKLSFQYYIPPYEPKKSLELTQQEEKTFKELNKKKTKEIETIPHYMQDVIGLSKVLEWGGVTFNNNEWFKIRIAMKKLMTESDAIFTRFWGKIYGLQSDYYIIQGSLRHYPLQKPGPYVDARGNEGLNRYTFWVSNSILEDWYELPDITPEQMVESKNFKYYFTGDLISKVRSFCSFPGKESHLLKCQILRIMHSSSIVPDGLLEIDGNYTDELASKITKYTENYQPPTLEEVSNDGKWVHEYGYIYPNGKIIDPSAAEPIDLLKGISEETYTKQEKEETVNVKWWRLKVVGDKMAYNKDSGSSVYAAVVLNNLRWPGTTTVWKNGEFVNIYVGFGIKAIDSPFNPTSTGDVKDDPDAAEEFPEPFPLNPDDIMDHDSLLDDMDANNQVDPDMDDD